LQKGKGQQSRLFIYFSITNNNFQYNRKYLFILPQAKESHISLLCSAGKTSRTGVSSKKKTIPLFTGSFLYFPAGSQAQEIFSF